MKWLVSRAYNRIDGFFFYLIGFMCAADSYWWMLLVVPMAIISATAELIFGKSTNIEQQP